jgi:hypothetical protein
VQHTRRHVYLQKDLREVIKYNTTLLTRNSSWTHSHRLHASFTLWKACECNTSYRKCMTFHWLLPNVHLHVNRMHIRSGSDKTIYYVHECASLYPTETKGWRLRPCAVVTARPQQQRCGVSHSKHDVMKVYRGADIVPRILLGNRLKRTVAQLPSRMANSNLGRDNVYRTWGRGDFMPLIRPRPLLSTPFPNQSPLIILPVDISRFLKAS